MQPTNFIFKGFSLIELMVVITIIGVMASIVYANFGSAGAKSRDAKRQADLKMLQNAIEQYKTKYGNYPAQGTAPGCGTPGSTFSTESTCSEYVVGLVPEFLPRLPRDPRRGNAEGFAYLTNNNPPNNVGTVYKAMVMNTVESEVVTDAHPMKSCDVLHNNSAVYNLKQNGWCSAVYFTNNHTDMPAQCKAADQRFQKSYGVWGGFLPLRSVVGKNQLVGDANDISRVRDTTAVICR